MKKYLLALIALLACAFAGSAFAQTAANTATITFQAATKRTDGTTPTGAVAYNVYQGLKGGSKTKVGTITATTASITTGLLGGNEYCWQVTAQEGTNTESAMSNEGCKDFPLAGMQPVTITVN